MRFSGLDITVFDDLPKAAPLWKQLQKAPSHYAFQSFEWISCWLAANPQPAALRIVVVQSASGQPLLLLPLCIRLRYGLRQLTFMAEEVSDYHAPLVAPEFSEFCRPGQFEELFQAILANIPGVDYVSFRWMPAVIEDVANPMAEMSGCTPGLAAFQAQLPTRFEDFLTRKRKKIHQDTHRQLKRLNELGTVTIERVTDPAAIVATVNTMLDQKAQRFARRSGPEEVAFRRFSEKFYAAIGAVRNEDGEGHVTRITCNGQIIATHIGILHGQRFYYIMPSFEADAWGRYSPGRILMEHLIKECITRGITIFDMTIGAEAYKRDWVDTELKLVDMARGISLQGKAFCAARALARNLRNLLRGVATTRSGG